MKPRILLVLTSLVMMITLSSCVTFEPYQYDENGHVIKDENENKETVKLGIIEVETETHQKRYSLDDVLPPDYIHPFAFVRPLSWAVIGPVLSFIPLHGTYPVVTPVLMTTIGVPTFLGLTVLDLTTLGYFENPIVVKIPDEETEDKSCNASNNSNDASDEWTYEYDSLTSKVESDLTPIIFWRPSDYIYNLYNDDKQKPHNKPIN